LAAAAPARLPKTDRLLLQVEGGGWAPLDWSPDDAKLLVGQGISATESHLWIVDAASGARTALTRAEAGRADYQGGVFSRDGHGVYTSTDQGSEFHRLTYVDLASGHHTPLSAGIDWDAVRASAESRGLPHESRGDLVEALFHDGLSTRTEVSLLSGRGVGLGAGPADVRLVNGAVAAGAR